MSLSRMSTSRYQRQNFHEILRYLFQILATPLTFRPIPENNKQDNHFSIKICVLNYRQFDRTQLSSSEKRKKSCFIETKCFCQTRGI